MRQTSTRDENPQSSRSHFSLLSRAFLSPPAAFFFFSAPRRSSPLPPPPPSQGCGIVEYEDIRGANRAIRELNNTTLGGRPIFVREDREQQNPRQRRGGGQANGGGGRGGENYAGRQLYVGNLSFETTWADLKDHFRSAGEVERADVMMDGSRRSKGWGTVRFSTPVRFRRREERYNPVAWSGVV